MAAGPPVPEPGPVATVSVVYDKAAHNRLWTPVRSTRTITTDNSVCEHRKAPAHTGASKSKAGHTRRPPRNCYAPGSRRATGVSPGLPGYFSLQCDGFGLNLPRVSQSAVRYLPYDGSSFGGRSRSRSCGQFDKPFSRLRHHRLEDWIGLAPDRDKNLILLDRVFKIS